MIRVLLKQNGNELRVDTTRKVTVKNRSLVYVTEEDGKPHDLAIIDDGLEFEFEIESPELCAAGSSR